MKQNFSNEEMYQLTALASRLHETGRLGFAIAKNTRKFKSELPEYIEKRNELLARYGTPEKDSPNRYRFTPESQRQYEAELSEYGSIECEIEVLQVSEEEFTNGSLDNTQMEALLWMVIPKKGEKE